ncbi:CRISPR-associated helicase/endonuclease Cas3 [Clostridia bacterium]|nr:CRISPR-associated helicase/endonuclease Cas3 [Clostridia bacterium]
MIYYAHTKMDELTRTTLPECQWQTLDDHLQNVADMAKQFAGAFDAASLAEAAGLLHDVGKATDAFQARLHGSKLHANHKTEGARAAMGIYGKLWGKLLAYIISGHHGGLPDDIESENESANLTAMLACEPIPIGIALPDTPKKIQPHMTASKQRAHQAFYITLLTRMVYSSLVDADYLDTEQFMQPRTAMRRGVFPPLEYYFEIFAPKLSQLLSYPQTSTVFRARRTVLNACLESAQTEPGLFRLTVPTGGGKTLSSLAFALEHAKRHGMQRVIYAIPFTSITEQNAQVFRDIFGEENVLEHHSSIVIEPSKGNDIGNADINRLASENWDAPLIVTTNVQLFESLFANKPSKARKIHRMAKSIIILDEAQTLPDGLLLPTLAALKSLAADFSSTIVFCTATQPALRKEWLDGMPLREIIPDTKELFNELKRVDINVEGSLSDAELVERISSHRQSLCIVNTRRHARRLFDMLEENDGNYHLSALMCAQHRTRVITEIKHRLREGKRCIVISTQLIEAGVDIDFPYVYRSMAGLDAIAQAAGRCNREGKRADESGNLIPGEVTVFMPEDGCPKGWFQRMAALGEETLNEGFDNPLHPDAITSFFNKRYSLGANLDEHNILSDIQKGAGSLSFQFKEIADSYKMIENDSRAIIIPYDDKCRDILAEARKSRYPASYQRRLQRYTVSVYEYEFKVLARGGVVRPLSPDVPDMLVLDVDEAELGNQYDSKFGLRTDVSVDGIFI